MEDVAFCRREMDAGEFEACRRWLREGRFPVPASAVLYRRLGEALARRPPNVPAPLWRCSPKTRRRSISARACSAIAIGIARRLPPMSDCWNGFLNGPRDTAMRAVFGWHHDQPVMRCLGRKSPEHPGLG
jgi:hypothetical protein